MVLMAVGSADAVNSYCRNVWIFDVGDAVKMDM
jgi:hypothetical protein